MTTTSKETIQNKTNNRHLLRRFCVGVVSVVTNPINLLLLAIYVYAAMLVWDYRDVIFGTDDLDLFATAIDALQRFALTICGVTGLMVILVLMGTPRGSITTREALQKIGLANHAGEAPVLVARYKDKGSRRLTVFEFDPCGLSLDEWEDRRSRIETALNITVAKMEWSEGRKIIRVYAAPAASDYPSLLRWRDEYISQNSFELVLGESLAGPVTVNLAYIPHILLGGSAGSGKSVLLKLLLMQALRKGAEVYIADFKGGVDFPKVWHEKCRMCFTEKDLLYTLNQLVEVLEYRKTLFVQCGCANLDEYNRLTGLDLPRVVFACDEVAEVLDKSGRSKEDKELLGQIESKLATIARLGRAFGVHLILATQRPDAMVIPGQIKNNLDFRVCGRADNVLSMIILDNTSAADQIPKDARGRFITGDGTVFQGYLFDDRQL